MQTKMISAENSYPNERLVLGLVPDGGVVSVQFWRHVSSHKVWYEWALLQPQISPIHNPNGRSYHIGL